jgi:hypothetical protein
MSHTVSTIGSPSSSNCRTPGVREGKRIVSPVRSHASIDQPSGNGVRRPRGSTIGSIEHAGWPAAVQFRWVMFIESPRCDLGMNDGDAGSYCCSAQKGRAHPSSVCRTVKFSTPRESWMVFSGSSSTGRVVESRPLIPAAVRNMLTARSGMLNFRATSAVIVRGIRKGHQWTCMMGSISVRMAQTASRTGGLNTFIILP